jgi:hypothetical protein
MNLSKRYFGILLILGFENDYNFELTENERMTEQRGVYDLSQCSCSIDVTQHGVVASDDINPIDNTNNFKALINTLKTSTHCLCLSFPPGIYYGVFTIPAELDDMSIIGSGIATTTLKMPPRRFSYPGSGGLVGLYGDRSSISNLTIDGNGKLAHESGFIPAADGYVCLHIQGNGTSVSDVKFFNSYNKQCVVRADQVEIRNSTFVSNFSQCRPNGIPCQGLDVDGVHLYGEAENHETIKIHNCSFENNGRAGVFIEQLITDVQITNNKFKGCKDGIKQQGRSSAINIKGNIFDACIRGVTSLSGLGIMTIDSNFFYIREHALTIHGGLVFDKVNTKTALSFTHNFNGRTYQKLGHLVEFKRNHVEFLPGTADGQPTNIFDIQTYSPGLAGTRLNKSYYNYVHELIINDNTFISSGISTAPDLGRFNTNESDSSHGFINKVQIIGNHWKSGN